jgi:hypothetical protein
MSTRRPRGPLSVGCATGSAMVTVPTGRVSVSDEQYLQWQPNLPCRLVFRDQAVAACVCSDAINQPAGRTTTAFRRSDADRRQTTSGGRLLRRPPQRDRLSGRPPSAGRPMAATV